ncbi:hypothetical protein [Actinoallomurus sp. NPDC052274]|uniref:hypothetical protein n=1 Tax=Actinoallomurus sp. NPDC052274 TaxID=3155420 RepID=UPI00343B66FF
MSSRNSERAALHGPWPSPAEELQGLYGEQYEIYRELGEDGRHGDWVAHPLPSASHLGELRAADIRKLAERLQAAADEVPEEETADE